MTNTTQNILKITLEQQTSTDKTSFDIILAMKKYVLAYKKSLHVGDVQDISRIIQVLTHSLLSKTYSMKFWKEK